MVALCDSNFSANSDTLLLPRIFYFLLRHGKTQNLWSRVVGLLCVVRKKKQWPLF